jgi:preprotein translocase subunit SecA
MSFIKRVFGDPNERELKKLRPIVDEINGMEDTIAALSDDDLRARTAEFRAQLEACADQDEQDDLLADLLPEAFAIVREAGRRTIGQRHYDVQLIGGIVLHQGKIAEMRTGEGKTLVATLPSYLNALTGRGVHVITVNDYLAHRDAEWMGQIHRFLGLSVGTILSGPEHQNPLEKKAAYGADITYGTNNEFGFDYLRDNMVGDLSQCVQRALHFAIVDEVDNILIDEARTPLIISAPAMESPEMYVRFARVVPLLKEGDDYSVDLKGRTVAITDAGIDKIEAALGLKNIYGDIELTRYLENALKAQVIFQRDRDYIVREGEVLIVDEHTGRILYGRRYNEGLHQAIEAKEHVKVQAENRTVATITFQNYFRLYRKLAGMTGTALTEAAEFDKIYKLDVMVIPTNKPMIRKDETDFVYRTEDGKFEAVVTEIQRRHEAGQPVLVGTTSVEKSELLARKLDRVGIAYELLNAKNHAREADIIAQAGAPGAVTISTNMAGRGTDILLGGNPAGYVDQILSERAIDIDIATEEDRAEALAEAERRCAEAHERVVELGGLHVIGTERHDSRRIDNQLRGRAGRQGDPGSTRFYISLEDDLMRRFGSERVGGLMDRLGMDDEMPIENNFISKMIEQAQQKVEAYYFDIRKHLVEYDDVIAKQRETIYADRRAILENQGVHERINALIAGEVEELVSGHCQGNLPEQWDFDAIDAAFQRWHMPLPDDFFPENLATLRRNVFVQQCVDWALEQREAKMDRVREQATAQGDPPEVVDANLLGLERNLFLQIIDRLWMEHIDAMDEMRASIGLRGIAQVDPLVEFKREGYASFEHLKQQIRHFVAETLLSMEITVATPIPQAPQPPRQLQTNTNEIAAATGQSKAESDPTAVKKTPKKPLTQTKAKKLSSAAGRSLAQPKAANGSSPATNGDAIAAGDGARAGTEATTPTGNGAAVVGMNGIHAAAPGTGTGTPKPRGIPAGKPPVKASTAHAAKATTARPPSRPLNGGSKARPVAPAPTAVAKVGPNDPCPCGSGQRYKFCHGLGKG